MASSTSAFSDLFLLIALLRAIPRDRFITTDELSDALKEEGFTPSQRTLQRLLQAIVENKAFKIEKDSSTKPYRYRWHRLARSIHIPAQSDSTELLTHLAQATLAASLPKRLMSDFEHQMEGLFCASPTKKSDWRKKVFHLSNHPFRASPHVETDILEQLARALKHHQMLALQTSEVTTKTVDFKLFGLFHVSNRLYVVGRFLREEVIRTLAADKIVQCACQKTTFVPPKDFDLKSFVENSPFNPNFGPLKTIVFTTKSEPLIEDLKVAPLDKAQKIKKLKNNLWEVRLTVPDSKVFQAWLYQNRQTIFIHEEKNVTSPYL